VRPIGLRQTSSDLVGPRRTSSRSTPAPAPTQEIRPVCTGAGSRPNSPSVHPGMRRRVHYSDYSSLYSSGCLSTVEQGAYLPTYSTPRVLTTIRSNRRSCCLLWQGHQFRSLHQIRIYCGRGFSLIGIIFLAFLPADAAIDPAGRCRLEPANAAA
jgi:hypothetical protein